MCVLCSLCVCVFGLKTPAIAWSKIHISQWCACRQNSIDQDCPKCHSRATMCHYLMNYHLVLVRNTLIGLASGSNYKFVRPSFSLLSLLNFTGWFLFFWFELYIWFSNKKMASAFVKRNYDRNALFPGCGLYNCTKQESKAISPDVEEQKGEK